MEGKEHGGRGGGAAATAARQRRRPTKAAVGGLLGGHSVTPESPCGSAGGSGFRKGVLFPLFSAHLFMCLTHIHILVYSILD